MLMLCAFIWGTAFVAQSAGFTGAAASFRKAAVSGG